MRRLPIAVSVLASGAAALVYQVVWVRQLTTVLGTTLEAVSLVLGLFMLGLGLGGALASRLIDRMPGTRLRPLYMALELGVGVFALIFPLLLGASASVLLLVPTTLMGATLPTAVAILERSNQGAKGAGRSAGVLYAFNTAGAVLGSLATGLFLLPQAGIRMATFGAVGLNVLAGALVLLTSLPEEAPAAQSPGSRKFPSAARMALAVAALSGFAALVSEVAWTRSLVLLIGPTTYGFSFVVSSVILGLALGSAAGMRSLAWAQIGAAVSSLALLQVLGRLAIPAGEIVQRHSEDMTALLGLELAGVALLVLPASFFFGATFPLVVGIVSRQGAGPAEATGAALAWNTLGALAGSLAAGFFLIPRFGAEGALYAALALHLLAAGLVMSPKPLVPSLAALALGAAAPLLFPRWDRELMTGGLYKYASYLEPGELLDFLRQGELLFYREDRVATVTVRKVASRLSLAIDGKVDATNSSDMMTQKLLAHVPLLLHRAPKNILVIGLGSGVTAGSALTHPIESLTAVEISEGVVDASAFFDELNHRPRSDPRFRLVVGDGRNHLLRSKETYDVIISEPSNPWMAGVGALFTREFFALARSRLAGNGLFCQWAHIYNMSESDLKTIVASFTDAFESTALFLLSESDILLVGAKESLPRASAAEIERRMEPERVRADLVEIGALGSAGVRALLAASTPPLTEWARSAARHTDDRPVLEFRAARSLHRDTSRENRRAVESIGIGDTPIDVPPVLPPRELAARAKALEAAESFHWAFETFLRAAEQDPSIGEASEGVVRTALRAGRTEEAERKLKTIAGPEAARALGTLYRRLGRLDEALALVDLGSRESLLLAADVSSDRGDTDAMARYSGLLLARDPLDLEAAAVLAEVRLREGDLALAARESASILAQSPGELRALQVHAVAHAELGNENLARESFERILHAAPEDWVQLNNLGKLELASGNAGKAAALFKRAVDVNSRNIEGYRGLQEAAEKTGDGIQLKRAESMMRFLVR